MDIRRNNDTRRCTDCDRYGHTTGRRRSRLAAKESFQQRKEKRQIQQHPL